jgi:hypothetical protein
MQFLGNFYLFEFCNNKHVFTSLICFNYCILYYIVYLNKLMYALLPQTVSS